MTTQNDLKIESQNCSNGILIADSSFRQHHYRPRKSPDCDYPHVYWPITKIRLLLYEWSDKQTHQHSAAMLFVVRLDDYQ